LLIHESGQWIKSIFSIENVVTKNKQGVVTGNALQHFGAGVTYARRYALSSIIGLAQEDNDAQSFNDLAYCIAVGLFVVVAGLVWVKFRHQNR
jgi:hypothetical protein